jgi:HAD superfamily hydrolase (TIGR01509 family)
MPDSPSRPESDGAAGMLTRTGALALLLDCDGVLVDSEAMSCGAWLPVLARYGVDAELAQIEAFLGHRDREVLEHFRATRDVELPDTVLAEKEAEYRRQATGRLQAFPGCRETLEILAARGMPMAVASSGSPEKIAFSLEQAGLADLLPVRVSTLEVASGKPAPDLFLEAARRLVVSPSSCIVVEDSVAGLEAAVAAGMTAIGFASSTHAAVLRAAGAHQIAAEWTELLPALVRARLGR